MRLVNLLLLLLVLSLVSAQGFELISASGKACSDCEADETVIILTAQIDASTSVINAPPCQDDMKQRTLAFLEQFDVHEAAFVLRSEAEASPLLGLLNRLPSEPTHVLARATDAFYSNCLMLGVVLPEGVHYRGYKLQSSKPTWEEPETCSNRREFYGQCGLGLGTNFSMLPQVLHIADHEVVITLFKASINLDEADGMARQAILRVYYRE